MIVFACQCGYTFVIDLEASKAIGPITAPAKDEVRIGNNRTEISLGAFRDFYGDCWGNLLSSIPNGVKK